MFRETLSGGGAVKLDICKGDNTTTVNHQISGQGNTNLCQDNGSVKIGGSGAPSHKLEVVGNIGASLGFVFPSYTAAQIAAIANAVNTASKFVGKAVFDTTNGRIMVATGATAGSTWKAADGGVTVTPS